MWKVWKIRGLVKINDGTWSKMAIVALPSHNFCGRFARTFLSFFGIFSHFSFVFRGIFALNLTFTRIFLDFRFSDPVDRYTLVSINSRSFCGFFGHPLSMFFIPQSLIHVHIPYGGQTPSLSTHAGIHMDTHRHTDYRTCGATTIVTGNSTVFADDLLVSVNGDPNTDGSGELIADNPGVYVEDSLVVIVGNASNPDDACFFSGGEHCSPSAATGSSDVQVG